MDTGVQIKTVWDRCRRHGNISFCVERNVRRSHADLCRDSPQRLPENFCGFPKLTDIREVTFGQFDLEPVRVGQANVNVLASGITMRFHCLSGACRRASRLAVAVGKS